MPEHPYVKGDLIDASLMLRTILKQKFPRLKIVTELDPRSSSQVPLLLVDVYGSDNPELGINGDGLWDMTMDLYLITHDATSLREYEVAVDREVRSWDYPRQGWIADVGGVSRCSRSSAFDDTVDVLIIGKDFRQSDATYSLRMRSLL